MWLLGHAVPLTEYIWILLKVVAEGLADSRLIQIPINLKLGVA